MVAGGWVTWVVIQGLNLSQLKITQRGQELFYSSSVLGILFTVETQS